MKFIPILLLLLYTVNAIASDAWNAFSNPFPIHSVIPYGADGIMLATDGGIRYRTLSGDYVFHSENGLETSKFYSIANSSLGVFAVSEFGLIAKLAENGTKWNVSNRSYLANNVRAVPGAAIISKNVLVIAFEDRLAFFDLQTSTSILTIDRIGNSLLSVTPIQNITTINDTLYVKTSNNIYARKMQWDSLRKDFRLSDPASWETLSQKTKIDEFEISDSTIVKVNGKILKDSTLYYGKKSRIKWTVKSNDGYFLVGPEAVFYYSNKSNLIDLTIYANFLLGETYELNATSIGGVFGASVNGFFSYSNGDSWTTPIYALPGVGSGSITASSARLKTLSTLPDGHVFFHIWGFVYQIYSDWGNTLEYSFTPYDGLCFDNYIENYPVSPMSVPAPDNSGFITASASNNGYSIVYFNKNGEVHCAKNIGSRSMPAAIFAITDDDGSWDIYIASRDGGSLETSGGIDVIKFPAPKSNGGELSNGVLKSYKGVNVAAIDIAYDSTHDNLWFATTSSIYYLDAEQDSLIAPTSTKGLRGAEYTSIDVDVHGNLWAGTANQGVYRLSQKKNSPDTLSVIHYTTKNGLLDDNVSDIAIDNVLGRAWFSHVNGVSYYQRNDLKDASKNMTDAATVKVKAYPVPFRPKVHSHFTIDGVSENATVSIFNRGGALVKSFRNSELLGGKLEWNGCDKKGNLVAPGVYYYVINNGSDSKKGKFIIAH